MIRRWQFIMICAGLLLFQVSCAKKVAPVSGSAGLSEASEGQVSVRSESKNGVSQQSEAQIGSDAPPFEGNSEGIAPILGGTAGEQALVDTKGGIGMADREALESLLDVYFEYDRAILRKSSKEALQKNANLLLHHADMRVLIEGHTDERGNGEYNLALGERRARAAKRFLMALGIESSRIKVISFGEEKPSCHKSEDHCWKKNRRAHFISQP